jgi:hypothetical protein
MRFWRVAVQIAGAFCIALGVGLFVFGQVMAPNPAVQALYHSDSPDLMISATFRGFGAGIFTIGLLGVGLPFFGRRQSVDKPPVQSKG